MTVKEKQAARDACVRGVPFFCGGHTIQPIPFGYLEGTDCCYQCEMDSECKGDILEMCEYVNGFKGYDEFCFKIKEPNYKTNGRRNKEIPERQSPNLCGFRGNAKTY